MWIYLTHYNVMNQDSLSPIETIGLNTEDIISIESIPKALSGTNQTWINTRNSIKVKGRKEVMESVDEVKQIIKDKFFATLSKIMKGTNCVIDVDCQGNMVFNLRSINIKEILTNNSDCNEVLEFCKDKEISTLYV